MWILAGRVTDDEGIGLAGVTIHASAPLEGSSPTPTKTDAQGRYTFHDLRPAHYRVKFVREGFQPLTRDPVSVSNPFVAIVDVQLVKTKNG